MDDVPDGRRCTDYYVEGTRFSAEAAAVIEAHLLESPDDLPDRVRMIGYTEHQAWQRKDCGTFAASNVEQPHCEHVLYLIEHHPASPYTLECPLHIAPYFNPASYARAKQLWLDHIERSEHLPELLWSASRFFTVWDTDLAERMCLLGQCLEPNSSGWPNRLSHILSLGNRSHGTERQERAERSLHHIEEALALDNDVTASVLATAARRAYEAQAYDKARSYAERAIIDPQSDNPNPARHHGHTVLGRLAVHDGDIEAAKEHLLASGRVGTSPTLASFGPSMALAQELLDRGDFDTVLVYLALCKRFWLDGEDSLNRWMETLKQRRIPDFGPNAKR